MQEPAALTKKEIAAAAVKKENVERQGRSSGIIYASEQPVGSSCCRCISVSTGRCARVTGSVGCGAKIEMMDDDDDR